MPKITLDLDELKRQRQQHQVAIERIDWMIENFFNAQDIKITPEKTDETEEPVFDTDGTSRMRRALKICQDYLKSGKKVRTMNEFLQIILKNQIKLSRAGLGLAFKMDESDIVFDKDAREWKLKN